MITQDVIAWALAHGYLFFFLIALIEGPLVTAAAGAAAALGQFSLFVIIVLSVLADLVADAVYYALGYWSRGRIVDKYGPIIGLSPERIEKTEALLHRHVKKALFIIKLSPVIPVFGLLLVGSTRVPLKRYITIVLLIALPKSLVFALVGFYSGKAYISLSKSIVNEMYLLVGIAALLVGLFYFYQKVTSYIASHIEQ